MANTQVAVVNKRKRIPDTAIADVVRQVVENFNPIKIILFGSYAYGAPRPESDVDLLVVLNTPLKETEQAIHILQSIEHHFGLDVIVKTPENLARRLQLGDPFLQEVVKRGEVVYERTHD